MNFNFNIPYTFTFGLTWSELLLHNEYRAESSLRRIWKRRCYPSVQNFNSIFISNIKSTRGIYTKWLKNCSQLTFWAKSFLLKIIDTRKSTKQCSRPRWLNWMRRPTGDQEVAGSTTAEVSNILSWRLIMKYFLQSFSTFCWIKKGSCQFLAKECAQYWLTA